MKQEQIPFNWEYLPVRALAISKNQTVNPKQFANRVFADFSMPAYDKGDGPNFIKGEQMESNRNQLSPTTTVLINKLNVRKERIWYIKEPPVNSVCTSEFIPLYPKKNVEGAYLKYALLNSDVTQKLISISNGSTNSQVRVKPNDILCLRILVPSLEVQKSIAHYLDLMNARIDEAISRHRLAIDKLEEYRRAIISCVIGGRAEEVDSSGWTWKRFKFIARVDSNLVEPNKYANWLHIAPDAIGKGNGKLLQKHTVSEDGVVSSNHLFRKGAILYSKVRPRLNKVVIAPDDGLCSADMYPISTTQNVEWLKFYMLSDQFVEQAGLVSDIRIKMPKINKQELGDIKILVPPPNVQLEIVSRLNAQCYAIDEAIGRQNQIIDKLVECRRSLIHVAVTGQIDCTKEPL